MLCYTEDADSKLLLLFIGDAKLTEEINNIG